MVTCESGQKYLTFRVGTEICAAVPETMEVYLCKTCGELEYLPTITFLDDMGDCMQMYCLYYYGEEAQEFPEYSIPQEYDGGMVGSDPLVMTCSSENQYLVFLDRFTVRALDVRTGYRYECRKYLAFSDNPGDHPFPFHDDMRECYQKAVEIYHIPEDHDTAAYLEWRRFRIREMVEEQQEKPDPEV